MQLNVKDFVDEAICSLREGIKSTRDLLLFSFKGETDEKTIPFRYQSNKELKQLKAFGSVNPEMAAFSFLQNDKEVRVGDSSHPFFSEMELMENIHTVKIRKGGSFIKEIVFSG